MTGRGLPTASLELAGLREPAFVGQVFQFPISHQSVEVQSQFSFSRDPCQKRTQLADQGFKGSVKRCLGNDMSDCNAPAALPGLYLFEFFCEKPHDFSRFLPDQPVSRSIKHE
jgi:hypothetical protein